MTKKRPVNLPASIHQRLLNLSVSRSEDPNLTLTRFTLERLLYRLAQSQYFGPIHSEGCHVVFAVGEITSPPNA